MRDPKITSLVYVSLNQYKNGTPKEKLKFLSHVRQSLADNQKALDSIGMGYSQKYVYAAKLFLRLIKLYKL